MSRLLKIGLILWIVSTPSATLAADVCFDESVAGQILVELEKGRALRDQLTIQESLTVELEKQIELLKQITEERALQAEQARAVIAAQKQVIEDQEKALARNQTTGAIEKFLIGLGSLAVGVLVGVGVALVL